MQISEIDALTGSQTVRDMTEEEEAQAVKDAGDYAEAQRVAAEKKAADDVARTAAIAHAKSLGFTDAMIAVMYPNLGATNE